ncbi:MAG TPA: PAS domain-containing protein, partial [Anaerolineae bacterium]|nr:PAS domain-containing protein [Anaerolineae bacterium]
MQIYLFATNLLTLTAFFLGLSNFSRGVQAWRLVPLFLLVVSQSTSLIVNLAALSSGQPSATAAQSVLALNVFSTFCAVWALIDLPNLSELWRRLAWVGGGLSLFLCLLPLIPGWPVPPQLHSLVISMVGSLLVVRSLPRLNGLHLATPLLLVIANFIGLLGYDSVFWLLTALAYALFVGALHWEGLHKLQQQQSRSEQLVQEAIHLSGQHQRYIEVSQIISRATSLDNIGSHLVRSLASVTHSDQAAIICLEPGFSSRAYVAAVFGAGQTADVPLPDFDLIECPPLHQAIERGQSLLLSPWDTVDLESLYHLWDERDEGPTLIQPLTLQGRSIGALVLGNPVTDMPLHADDQALCRNLAAQLAILVEAYRRRREATRPVEVATIPKIERPAETRPELEHLTVTGATDYAGLLATAAAPRPAFRALPLAAEAKTVAEQSEISPENYLTIIDALTEGVVVSNVHGRVWLANAAAERILGQSRAELLNRPIGAIYGKIDSSGAIEELVADFSRRD